MSVLASPRIYFKGHISWDPIVTNNYPDLYDENSGETVFAQATNKVKVFRDEAISRVPKGIWNPHGTHRSQFFDTEVTGYDLGAGLETADPFVSAAVELTGMLVDLEPYGATTSQIFFDSIKFGVEGGYGIFAPRTTRFTARYINFSRNSFNKMIAGVASVVWQTSFSKSDGLRVESFNSPILQKLSAALKEEDVLGLTVRFNAYRTVYYGRDDLKNGSSTAQEAALDLQKKLQNGGFQPNPARSLLVGTLGLWRKGEPAHEPGDRSLNQIPNSHVATAHARVDGNRLILDLSNSICEIDANLTKMDLGDLTIVAIDPVTKTSTTLGTIAYSQYNRTAYEASGGLVAIPLSDGMADLASTRNLQLRNDDGTLLNELPLRAIPQTPNVYLDEGETANATFQVYNRGLPFHAQISMNLYKVGEDGTPGPAQAVQTDVDGMLTVPLTAAAGSVISYVPSFDAEDKPSDQGINPLVNTYMYVRVRPADTDIEHLPPTWENVYAHVLANWNAMAPCMDNWLKLDDPVQIQKFSPMLKMLTDPLRFESYRFMPVTRDMSAGQRALLYKFLDAAQPAALPSASDAPTNPNFASLSRSMRRT